MKCLKIIMAGGRARRMGREKALLKVGKTRLIERIYNACYNACDVVVALTHHTPETKKFCVEEKIPFIRTPGNGYVEDVQWLLKEYGPFLSVCCDIPFLREEDIREIEREFCWNKTLTGCIDLESIPKLANAKIFAGKCIVGINTVSYGEEEFFTFSNPLLAFNINTPFDLYIANKMASFID
jgi:adenosylcobinamide-phosphate guanylyltransferase